MSIGRLKAIVEALLFSSHEPVPLKMLTSLTEASSKEILWVLDELKKEYSVESRGIELAELAGGYIFRTRSEHASYVQKLFSERKSTPISYAALETLAIIAYQQPVTRIDVEKIRGVSADSTIQTLLERRLIKETGRLESPGRPILYGTTPEFMVHFGLKNLEALPPLEASQEDFEEEMGASSDRQTG